MCHTCENDICTNRCASILQPHPIPGAVGDEEPIRMANEPGQTQPVPLEHLSRHDLIQQIYTLGKNLELVEIARSEDAKAELALRDMLAAALNDGGVVAEIRAERQRQISAEGWTPEHDDEHDCGELSAAAACYVMNSENLGEPPEAWPWAPEWWKPSSYRRGLIKAGALIVAEVERLDRAETKEVSHD